MYSMKPNEQQNATKSGMFEHRSDKTNPNSNNVDKINTNHTEDLP